MNFIVFINCTQFDLCVYMNVHMVNRSQQTVENV